MLQMILERTIAEIENADIAPLSLGGTFDAVLTCRDEPDEGIVRSGRTPRLVNVTRSGDVLHIVEKSRRKRQLPYASHDMVIQALIGTLPQPRMGLLGRIWAWLSGPVGETRNAEIEAPKTSVSNRLAPLNGWLAQSLLKHHKFDFSDPGKEQLKALVSKNRRAIDAPALPGLDRLEVAFDLSPAERDLLLGSALAEASPEAARLIGNLNGKSGLHRLTIANVADLGHDVSDILASFNPERPLADFGLAQLVGDGPLVSRQIVLPQDVVGIVLGTFDVSPTDTVALPTDRANVPTAMAEEVDRLCDDYLMTTPDAMKTVVVVTGAPDSGRRDVALAIAGSVRRRAVEACLDDLGDSDLRSALRRTVAATDTALIIDAANVPRSRSDLQHVIRGLRSPVVIISGPDNYPEIAGALDRPTIPLEMLPRSSTDREVLWRKTVPGLSAEAHAHVAERFDLGRRGIERASRLALLNAQTRGKKALDAADLREACDQLRSVRFDGAAERLPCRFRRSDIVLDDETSAELDLAISWASHGSRLFSDDGVAGRLRAGEGLSCMFFGPPGTGKTMAAQIIAREIDYALYRIDLSQVFDKFIGESEKKLAALFDEAERARVALFFDEADSCFGKRTEVRDSHDRYANMGTNFLLQRLESFTGLSILATNFASNIDDAFVRRIRVKAKFNAPGPAERREIWDLLLPSNVDRAEDIDLDLLSGPFEIVGGEIRNAIYTAHLLAAAEESPLAMRHCVRGLWRELGKIGRLTDRANFGKWQEFI